MHTLETFEGDAGLHKRVPVVWIVGVRGIAYTEGTRGKHTVKVTAPKS